MLFQYMEKGTHTSFWLLEMHHLTKNQPSVPQLPDGPNLLHLVNNMFVDGEWKACLETGAMRH